MTTQDVVVQIAQILILPVTIASYSYNCSQTASVLYRLISWAFVLFGLISGYRSIQHDNRKRRIIAAILLILGLLLLVLYDLVSVSVHYPPCDAEWLRPRQHRVNTVQ